MALGVGVALQTRYPIPLTLLQESLRQLFQPFVAILRSLLSDQYPAATIELLGRTRACVAETVVSEEYCLTNRDMVEFFPPLSGG